MTGFIVGLDKQQFLRKIVIGDSNSNDKYVLSERAVWTMNFDTCIIKIGWKIWKLWALKKIQYGKHLAAILNI